MKKQTKIVATVSDLRCDSKFIKQLVDAGVNVIRLNTAHFLPEYAPKIVEIIRSVASDVAILVDTKGPEIRTVCNGEELQVETNDQLQIIGNPAGITKGKTLYVTYPKLCNDIETNQHILIDDGKIDLIVESNMGDSLICRVLNGGKIELRKSVNIPNIKVDLPAISERDIYFIQLAIELQVDYIAHSFVQRASDIREIKAILKEKQSQIAVIAKIENQAGIENLKEILEEADGIMVARGDLGIEIPIEKVPAIQRRIVKECINCKKMVIIATQMLHTMIDNPRPTRAEISDIATAVLEKADALMLSGETATGDYPVEAVQTMAKVAVEVEKEMETLHHYRKLLPEKGSVLSLLAYSTVTVCLNLPIKAVIVDTLTGRTAHYLAAYRGTIPVYAICYSEAVQRRLALTYGITAFTLPLGISRDGFIKVTIENLLAEKLLKPQDQIVIVGGSFGTSKGATFIEISEARDLLQSESDLETDC